MTKDVHIHNMTQGNPAKLILSFAFPLMLGNVFQQLYTFVDTMVVGQALGVQALAAMGAVEWLTFLMFGLVQGLTQGFSVVLSQKFGAKDEDGLKRALFHAVVLSGTGAVLFTALALGALETVLILMGTPEEILGLSADYLGVIYAGIPVAFLYNLLAAMLRAVGNSRTPLQAMTVSSVSNIVLDLLFVYGFQWGIQGAAAATVLSQALASALCFLHIRRTAWFRLGREHCRAEKEVLAELLCMGLPMGVQNVFTALGGVIVQSVINGFGVLFIAGYTAANKLYGLLEIAASSYGYAMSSYAGQNKGAGRMDRIGKGLRAASLIGVCTAWVMSAVMLLFGRNILGCFLTGDAAMIGPAMEIGYHFLCVLAVFFPLLYLLYIVRSCVQGMGNAFIPMISSVVQLMMRVGCALLLTRVIGESGVFYGEVLAWAGANVLLWGCYGYMRK